MASKNDEEQKPVEAPAPELLPLPGTKHALPNGIVRESY